MSAGSRLLTKSVPLYVIATMIILLRCYVRTRIVKSFGKDDWAMLGAGVCIAITQEALYGFQANIPITAVCNGMLCLLYDTDHARVGKQCRDLKSKSGKVSRPAQGPPTSPGVGGGGAGIC